MDKASHKKLLLYLRPLINGGLAGMSATTLMTRAMRYLFGSLPDRQHYPLPPREIIESIDEKTGEAEAPLKEENSSGRANAVATVGAHYGYGAAAGSLFALQPYRTPVAGAAFGVGVWTASYLGWLPATSILSPATHHPRNRNLLMLAAHVVWGAALSSALREIERAEEEGGVFAAEKPPRDLPR